MVERHQIFPVFLENSGCDHRCIFCAQDKSSPAGGFDVQRIAAELEQIVPGESRGEIAFYGGSFTQLSGTMQQQLLDLATLMVDAGRATGIRLSTRPDALGHEVLTRLGAAPVTTVELGCQSFDTEVLRLCNRNHTPEAIEEAVHSLQHRGFRVGLQLMPGLPGGDSDEALYSLDKALSLCPDFLRIYPAVVLAGTPLERMWKTGDYRPWSLSRTVRVGAQMIARAQVADIPVIRFGLQGNPSLEKNLAAGPYHPALGQLVKSRLWFDRLVRQKLEQGDVIRVHHADLSDVIGYKRRNLRALHRRFGVAIESSAHVSRGSFQCGNGIEAVMSLGSTGGLGHVGNQQ